MSTIERRVTELERTTLDEAPLIFVLEGDQPTAAERAVIDSAPSRHSIQVRFVSADKATGEQ